MRYMEVIAILAGAFWLGAPGLAAGQPVGPVCLEVSLDEETRQVIEIVALPVGGSHILLSGVSVGFPYSGAASIKGEQVAFSLIAAFPIGSMAAGAFAGVIDTRSGTGQGTCSAIDAAVAGLACGTGTPVTYAVVGCAGAQP